MAVKRTGAIVGHLATTKVVKSVFVLFVMRGHDIQYNDWGRRYSVDLYIAVNLLFVYCAQSTVLFSYRKLSLF